MSQNPKVIALVAIVIAAVICIAAAVAIMGKDDPHAVKYHLDGGEFVGDHPGKYEPGVVLEVPSPIKHGYSFHGWYNVKFEGNWAGEHGGAVCMNSGVEVTLSRSILTGNHAGKDGGAIFLGEKDNEFLIGDTVVVKDNDADGVGPNVYIRGDSVITCSTINGDTDIGVLLERQERAFTQDFAVENPDLDPAKVFKSDSKDYYVAVDPDTKEAKTFKDGSSGDMSGNNTIMIVGGIIAVLAIIGIAVYAVKLRKP